MPNIQKTITQKPRAITLVRMMARISRKLHLSCHHPLLPLLTTTWGIRTTIKRTGTVKCVRCCVVMALRVIISGTRAAAATALRHVK
jgi:hypothetical protein